MSETNGATTTPVPKGGPMGSGTVGGLMAFYDFLITKGIATAAAIAPIKSASRQVFEMVEGSEDIDEIDVRSMDVEEYLDRFQVKAIGSGRYKPDSINAYRSRFTRGLESYLTYLTTGNVPKFRLRAVGSTSARKRQQDTENGSNTEPVAAPAAGTPALPDAQPSSAELISYPFPLQSGKIATLRLPVRLERGDAERLGAFIRTLVFEPQKELTEGHPESGPDVA